MKLVTAGCLALLAAVLWNPAFGQSFPAKPVRLIVPFPAGGGLDFTTRIIAQKLGDIWGQSVVVENRPGASGMIGAESVVRAPIESRINNCQRHDE